MAHVVSGKLRKEPFIKPGVGQNGESTMYSIELSEVVKEWNSDEKHYSNYKALFFAKTPNANEFYAKAFAQGSFVTVACEKLKVEQRDHNGQVYVSLVMENPRLEGALPVSEQGQQQGWGSPQQPNNGQPYQQPQQQPQQPQQQQQYNQPPSEYDQNIQF